MSVRKGNVSKRWSRTQASRPRNSERSGSVIAAARSTIEPLEKRVLLTSTTVVDHSTGFANTTDLQLNNGATVNAANKLVLTDSNNNEARTAFTTLAEGIDTFDTTFEYDYGTAAPGADGFTFAVQSTGPGAVGGGGGSLAYDGGFPHSLAIKFDLYDANPANGVGNPKFTNQDSYNATGLFINGTGSGTDDPRVGYSPTVAIPIGVSVDLAHNPDGTDTGINFHKNSTDKYMVHLVYDGKQTITETFTDETKAITLTQKFDLGNIGGATYPTDPTAVTPNPLNTAGALMSGDAAAPADVGFVGFTAATGGANSTQEIQTWKYTGTEPDTAPASPVTGLTAAFDPNQSGVVLNWTDGAGAGSGGQVNQVQRSSGGGAFTTIAQLPGDATTFLDTQQTGLQMGGSYTYQVVAANNVGTAAPSNQAGPVAVPAASSNLGVEAHVYNTQFWQGPAVADDRFLNINIDFGNNKPDPAVTDHNTFSMIYSGKVQTTSAGTYTFVSNTDDDGYLYVNGKLVSSDPGGHGQRDATDPTNTQGQVIPIVLSANTAYDFVFYLNQQGGGAGAHMEWITPDNGTEAPVQASSLSPTVETPPDPSNLAQDVANSGPNEVALTWTDGADKSSMYYEIDRAPAANGAATGAFAEVGRAFGALNGSLSLGATGFHDQGVTPGGQYAYEVRAVGPDGNSAFSNMIFVTAPTTGTNHGEVEEHLFNTSFFAETPTINKLANNVNLNGPNGTFDPSIRGSQNSSAWTGKIHITQSGTYTFFSNTDDEGYLYVNGALVSEDLGGHGQRNATTVTPISLQAGHDYNFLLLQNNQGGGSGANMLWFTPAMNDAGATAPVIVPSSVLTSLSDTPATPGTPTLALDNTATPPTPIAPTANAVQLDFTADNNAVFRYELQRSLDNGTTWVTVGQADPGSNDPSAAADGTFVPGPHWIEDAQPVAGSTALYRVLSMNFDGTSAPSPTLSVTVPAQVSSTDLSKNPPGFEAHFYNGEIFRGGEQFDTRLISDVPIEAQIGTTSPNLNTATPNSPDNVVRGAASPGLPDASDVYRIHPQSFSAVITGKIVTDGAGVYTLVTNTDDDGFLYMNGQLVSADPGGHGQQDASPNRGGDTLVPLTLAANTAYNYAFFMTNVGGGSGYHLEWIEPGAAAGTTPTAIPTYTPGTSPTGGLVAIEDTPSAVTGLHLIKTSTEIEVVWNDSAVSELGYEVQRSSDGGTTFQTIGFTGIDEAQFIDKGAQTGSFQYRVRGWNYDGLGAFSAPVATSAATTPVVIDHSGGFTSGSDLQLNTTALLTGASGTPANALQLVPFDAANTRTGSAYEQTLQGVATFDTTFNFELNPNNAGVDPAASGLAFVLQEAHTSGTGNGNGSGGPFALGNNGGGLGYSGTDHSVAIKFRITGGRTATGVYTGGTVNDNNPQPVNPAVPAPIGVAIDLTTMKNADGTTSPTGLNFHTNPNDVYTVHLSYDGTTLTETFTDVTKNISVSQQYTVNIPGAIGDNSAFVGFTGSHGGAGGEQDILNWKYAGTDTVTGTGGPVSTINDAGGITYTFTQDADGTDVDVTGGTVTTATKVDPNGLTMTDTGPADTLIFTGGTAVPKSLTLGGTYVVSSSTSLTQLQSYLASKQIKSTKADPNYGLADVVLPASGGTQLSTRLKGDANGDGTVNFKDLVILAANYNTQSGADWAHGDFTYDGKVGFADLVALAGNYNKTATAVASASQSLSAAVQVGTKSAAHHLAPHRRKR